MLRDIVMKWERGHQAGTVGNFTVGLDDDFLEEDLPDDDLDGGWEDSGVGISNGASVMAVPLVDAWGWRLWDFSAASETDIASSPFSHRLHY